MRFESPMQVLHWLPEEDRWELIGWADWVASVWPPQACLPGVPAGIHYFIVCIHHDGVPLNLIPHKYLVEPDGRIGADNFAGLSRTERDDYRRLMLLREPHSSDMAQLHELRQKMRAANFPPRGSLEALQRALPQAPKITSFAHRFLAELQNAGS